MTINCFVAGGKLLDPLADDILTRCNDCSKCLKDCSFLRKYGTPGQIVELRKTDPEAWSTIAFECSLCGLCTAVCPFELDVQALFLLLRQQAVKDGAGRFPGHSRILNYEKRGTSKRYSWYRLPDNCHTIFFPGCTLPGTRPSTTLKTYQYLQSQIENIGVVLDCCTKPSYDLGRLEYFTAMFSEMTHYLLENGIRQVVVTCPNCYNVFSTHAKGLEVKTVYEIMAADTSRPVVELTGEVALHDPCSVRFDNNIHDATRQLIQACGLTISDSRNSRSQTFCCGEGGSVSCLAPEMASAWTNKRVEQSGSKKIASYCAGCVGFLSQKTESFHLLDLIFDPKNTIKGKAKVYKAPFTYLNRLRLKQTLKKKKGGVTRERCFSVTVHQHPFSSDQAPSHN